MKNLLALLLTLFTITLQGQDITGQWNGQLEVQGTELRIIFHVEKDGENYTATLDSPDQGATGIPTTATTYEDNTLTITATDLGMTYRGQLIENSDKVKGIFNQGPMSLPLELSREFTRRQSQRIKSMFSL